MAVFTHVSEPELRSFLSGYDFGDPIRFEGIMEGVENTNYHVFTTKGRCVLTLYEKRTAADALPFVFGFMDHLNAKGIPCPRLIPDCSGQTLGSLMGRPAALQTFLKGHGTLPGTMNADQCRAMGVLAARLHLAGRDLALRRENPMGLATWIHLYEKTRDRADTVESGLSAQIAAQIDSVRDGMPHGLESGAIHADLFPDNVFFDQNVISGVIDFGFACTDLLAYDLAIAINAWCFDAGNAFVPEHFRALIQGYASLRPLSPAERSALPLLCRAAALRILMTRLHDWLFHPGDGFVRPKKPDEYIRKLEFHTVWNLFEAESV